MEHRFLSIAAPVAGQCAAVLCGLALLAFRPPAEGRMLLMPLGTAGASDMVAHAIDGGAMLVGRGPLPGSVIVSGSLARISARVTGAVLILSAPPGGCGPQRRSAA